MKLENDKRMVELRLSKGLMKHSEYEAFLKQLPDEASNAEWVEIDPEESESLSNGDAG